MTDKIQQTTPDHELIERILSGEKNLFEIIIRRYNQRLYRIGMSVLKNDEAVEDAMQTAYINAYEHLKGFENRSAFGTWLTRIMLNECFNQKKKKQFHQIEENDSIINMKTPATALINKELNAILGNAISQLPEKYRLVFVLREIEEMSVRETSDALSIEEPNVKVRLNRAKTMLRNQLTGFIKGNLYDFHLSRCDKMVGRVMNIINPVI